MRLTPSIAVVGLGPLLLGVCACGPSDPGAAGDEPITPQAVAALALDHLPADPTFLRRADREGAATAAEIRYGSDVDGEVVYVSVSESPDASPCDDERAAGCTSEDVDEGTLFVYWEDVEPEEDPGIVGVVLRRDDGVDVSTVYAGDEITADPRTLDLGVSVQQMTDVVSDPRLGLTTSQDAIDAGDALDGFDDVGRGRGSDTE